MIKGELTNRKLNDFSEGDEVIVKFIDTNIDAEEYYQKDGVIDNISEDIDDDLPISVIFNGDKKEYDFYKPEQLELVKNDINKKGENEIKFKIGDKVKYIKENEGDDASDKAYLNQIGEIIEISEEDYFSHVVKFDNYYEGFLHPSSLELVDDVNKQEKSKLKFKEGDKVKYVKEGVHDDSFDKTYLGQFGKITKVLIASTQFPYEVKFHDGTLILFSEESLELVEEENKILIEYRDNFIELKKFSKPTVVFRIDLNGNVYKIPIDERENYDEFSEEAIVALLDDDIEGYIEAVQNIENDYSEYIIKKIGEDLNV